MRNSDGLKTKRLHHRGTESTEKKAQWDLGLRNAERGGAEKSEGAENDTGPRLVIAMWLICGERVS
jgi:hypothetical protein